MRAPGLQYMPISEEIVYAACPHAAGNPYLNPPPTPPRRGTRKLGVRCWELDVGSSMFDVGSWRFGPPQPQPPGRGEGWVGSRLARSSFGARPCWSISFSSSFEKATCPCERIYVPTRVLPLIIQHLVLGYGVATGAVIVEVGTLRRPERIIVHECVHRDHGGVLG